MRGIQKLAGVAKVVAIVACLTVGTPSVATAAPTAAPRPPSGLDGKLFVGYQGWFGCPGDFGGNKSWVHWFADNKPDAEHLRVDLLPETDEYPKGGLCPTSLKRKDGAPIELFTSQNAGIVRTHFQWMADYGIDGAAIQRFVAGTVAAPIRARLDHVLMNERMAAEATGREFFLVYDISAPPHQDVVSQLRRDWKYVVRNLKITSSPNYLRDHGKPVLEIWGFGFVDRPGNPRQVMDLLRDLKTGSAGLPAAFLIGGVPPEWQTLNGSAKADPRWADVYRLYDVISPWFPGRFRDPASARRYLGAHLAHDIAKTKSLGIGYMPVIFPGFSWSNAARTNPRGRRAVLNLIPRRCGRFYWAQIREVLAHRPTALYGAMFDEVDEGTALFKVANRERELPEGTRMVFLDEDGCSLPSDWYLRITAQASRFLKSQRVPPRHLNAVLPEPSVP